MNSHQPLLLTILTFVLAVAAVLVFQPYSAEPSGQGFTQPAKHFITTALRQDSAELVRLSAGDSPVVWALSNARLHRESLAFWTGHAEAWAGPRSGDTTEVFLYPAGDECSTRPIEFRFIGSGDKARVLSLRSSCLDTGR